MSRIITTLCSLSLLFAVSPAAFGQRTPDAADPGKSEGGTRPVLMASRMMTPGLARIVMRDALLRRHLHSEAFKMGGLFEEATPGTSFFEARNIRVTPDRVAFDVDVDVTDIEDGWAETLETRRNTTRVEHRFRTQAYCIGPSPAQDRHGEYFSPFIESLSSRNVYAWRDQLQAGRFCDAWNELVHHARNATPDGLPAFAGQARNWRERPESRPKAPQGLDRHRVLAEHNFKDGDIVASLEHYEAGLRIHPAWNEGWFNAALLYEVLGEYEYAADRMRHYLLLAPSAPDAIAAREKLTVWQEKAGRE